MIRVGLTGSIGMGKTTTAGMFADLGVPVFDADGCVHALYGPGASGSRRLRRRFPDVVSDDGVDRRALSQRIQDDRAALKDLERLIHPLVGHERRLFVRHAKRRGADVVVFDIPLLFESGGDRGVDAIVVVTAPADVQRERVLSRPGMTPTLFDAILERQVPDSVKRARADYVIDTSRGLTAARRDVWRVFTELRRRARRKV